MSKYNIISKTPDRNVRGNRYQIEYQVEGQGSRRFFIELVCIGNTRHLEGVAKNKWGVSYAFFEKKADEKFPFIETSEDRTEFLSELYQFQLGNSYRKSHPINESELDVIIRKHKELQKQLSQLELEKRKIKDDHIRNEIEYLYPKSDKTYINRFKKGLDILLEGKYTLKYNDFCFSSLDIFVIDTELDIPIIGISTKDNKIICKEPSNYEKEQYIEKYHKFI